MIRTLLSLSLCCILAPVASAQPGWTSMYSQDGHVVFTYPTYNGVEINQHADTLLQWSTEVTTLLGLPGSYAGYQAECVVGASVPPCSGYQVYNTAGYNYGNWQVHGCSYSGWTWDNCYERPKAILITEPAVSAEAQSWGVVKALYR